MATIDDINAELETALAEERSLEKESAQIQAERELEIERAKIRATGWTSLGVNLVTVGVFAQIVSFLFFGKPKSIGWDEVAAIMICCAVISFFLHLEGQEALKKGYSL